MSAYAALCKSLGYKHKNVIWNTGQLVVSDSTPIEIKSHQYDEYLLDRARTQWQFGDWESLVKLQRDSLEQHPERAKLALLAAAGHQQVGDMNAARDFVQLARDWGCDKQLISRVLVAGVYNTLGKAAALGGKSDKALGLFEEGVKVGMPGGEGRLLIDARTKVQLAQLGFSEEMKINSNETAQIVNNFGLPPISQRLFSTKIQQVEVEPSNNSLEKHTSADRSDRKDLSQIFLDIYSGRVWGQRDGWEFYSGSGSHDNSNVEPYVDGLDSYFGASALSLSVLDIGCGDFNVGSQISGKFLHYTAVDVVPELIEYNKQKYDGSGVKFLCIDATRDGMPKADVMILRQVLQHLANDGISRLLNNIRGSYKHLVVVEHVPFGKEWPRNLDFSSGKDIRLMLNSGVDIEAAPFFLVYKTKHTISETYDSNGVIRTIVYSV
jgi:SAM-dependent methyltransferase